MYKVLANKQYLFPQWVQWRRKVVVTFFQCVKFIFMTTNERTFQLSKTRSEWSEKLISQIGKILQ
jgi:hypothetical protein